MGLQPSIRTTDALGRYVLKHRVVFARPMSAAMNEALSMGRRLFASSRGIGRMASQKAPEAIRVDSKGMPLCALSS